MNNPNSISKSTPPHLTPNQLATLLSVLDAYAHAFFIIGAALNFEVADAQVGPSPYKTIKSNKALMDVLQEIKAACLELDLKVTLDAVEKLLDNTPSMLEKKIAAHTLGEVRNRAITELRSRDFLYVPAKLAAMYRDEFPLGRDVHDRFPEIATDAMEASRCFALGRHTASAFHIARVLEHGLHFFADRVKATPISSKPTWGTYLTAIRNVIAVMPDTKKSQKDKKAKYQKTYDSFDVIREVWRNPIAHDLGLFVTPDDAENLFARAKQVYRCLIEAFPKGKR